MSCPSHSSCFDHPVRYSVTYTRRQSPIVLIVAYNLKWLLPSKSLPVHYSTFNLSFDHILSDLVSAPCMLLSSPISIIHPVHSITPIEMVLIVHWSDRLFHFGNRWTSFDKMCYQHCAIWGRPKFMYIFVWPCFIDINDINTN